MKVDLKHKQLKKWARLLRECLANKYENVFQITKLVF